MLENVLGLLHKFQSTRPSRGATAHLGAVAHLDAVSIHAPLAGRDDGVTVLFRQLPCFNPRAPRGARHLVFLRFFAWGQVSIHAPLAGRDNRL